MWASTKNQRKLLKKRPPSIPTPRNCSTGSAAPTAAARKPPYPLWAPGYASKARQAFEKSGASIPTITRLPETCSISTSMPPDFWGEAWIKPTFARQIGNITVSR